MPLGPSPIAGRRGALEAPPAWKLATERGREEFAAYVRAHPTGEEPFADTMAKLPGRAGAFLGLTGAEARAAPWLTAGIPRGLASALRPQPGERLGGLGEGRGPGESRMDAFTRGMEEQARALPGGESALGVLDTWERRADEADLPSNWRLFAGVGAPDIGDFPDAYRAMVKAYQGSPNLWELPEGEAKHRLRGDKLGTGEGAHVRGYGHYLAEKHSVARYYRGMEGKTQSYVGDVPYDTNNPEHAVAMGVNRWQEGMASGDPMREEAFDSFRGRRIGKEQSFVDKYQDSMDKWNDLARKANDSNLRGDYDNLTSKAMDAQWKRDFHQAALDGWGKVHSPEGVAQVTTKPKGTLIEGTIDVNYEDVLDLDKSLGEQSEHVKEGLSKLGVQFGDVETKVKYSKGVDPNTNRLDPGDLRVTSPGNPTVDIYTETMHETPRYVVDQSGTTMSWHRTKKSAIEAAKKQLREGPYSQNMTGDEFRKSLERKLDRKGASEAMQKSGIPGSMFFDEGSRFPPHMVESLDAEVVSRMEAVGGELDDALDVIDQELFEYGEFPLTSGMTAEVEKLKFVRAKLLGEDPRTRNFVIFPGGEHLYDVEKLNDEVVGGLSLPAGPIGSK